MTPSLIQDSTRPRPQHGPALHSKAARTHRRAGYILLETMVALVVLGAGSYAVHGAIRQAMITRAQAQDYTNARFLLEQVIGKVELKPKIRVGSDSGNFAGDLNRFSWKYTVKSVNVPRPPRLPSTPSESPRSRRRNAKPAVEFLLHIRATVSWERAGRPFEESFETLFNPSKLWEESEEEERLQ